MKQLVIEGSRITDIPSFYAEINRVFMQDEDWKLGESLDAFNDLLYGGFGALQGAGPVELIWNDMNVSQEALGLEATKEFYREKLKHPETYNTNYASEKLQELESGTGQTYFEIILEIVAEHQQIRLSCPSS